MLRPRQLGWDAGGVPLDLSIATSPVWDHRDDIIPPLPAYQEIREDKHPVIVVSARDIVEILAKGA